MATRIKKDTLIKKEDTFIFIKHVKDSKRYTAGVSGNSDELINLMINFLERDPKIAGLIAIALKVYKDKLLKSIN